MVLKVQFSHVLSTLNDTHLSRLFFICLHSFMEMQTYRFLKMYTLYSEKITRHIALWFELSLL